MIRVRLAGREASVDGGRWRGDQALVALGRALEPVGGVSCAYPDPDHFRALTLAGRVGGEVLDQPAPSTAPIGGAPE